MAEFVKLKQQRGRVKSQLTRSENAITQNRIITAAEAQIRIRVLEESFVEFQKIQACIEEKETIEDPEALSQESEGERQLFEERYFTIAGKLQEIINTEARLNSQSNQQQVSEQTARQDQIVRVETRKIKKPNWPEMKLVEFNGEYRDWVFFRNSFETSIHKDEDLTPIQKQQYLVGVLKGEALKVIEGFAISNENYLNAWQLLKDTYDNEMMIIETHLEDLFNFPPVTREGKAESIKKLIWHIKTHTQSLKSLKQSVDHWDVVIIHLSKKKLDYVEKKEWQESIKGKTPDNMPTLEEFIKFLTERCHTLRMINQNSESLKTTINTGKTVKQKDRKPEKRFTMTMSTELCGICNGNHSMFKCEEFAKISSRERRQLVMKKGLCCNCLRKGHIAKYCTSSTCRTCKGKHNTLLHIDTEDPSQEKPKQLVATANHHDEQSVTEPPVCLYCVKKLSSQVILATVKLNLYGHNNKKVQGRALLDSGSQNNLITINLVKKLQLPQSSEIQTINGVNRTHTSISKSVIIRIESIYGGFETEMNCLVLSSITDKLPQTRLDIKQLIKPEGVNLADPEFTEPGEVDLLIGAGLYWKLIIGTPRTYSKDQPTWQETQLGWICGGEVISTTKETNSKCFTVTNVELQEQLERFWVQEAIEETKQYTKQEEECEHHFQDTMQQINGQFMVRLPLKSDVQLGESKFKAEKRLYAIERRFKRDPNLRLLYSEFMTDYLAQGHMSLMIDTSVLQSKEHYFIPHHSVVRPDSITTKLRVVFDASATTPTGNSLNSKLLTGPNLQGDLFQIVIKFRTHQFVLTGDITQMYRQILVHPEDRIYQLILWRRNEIEKIQVYELNTVTYGTACAPFHALRCLKEVALQNKNQYPLTAKVIEEDIYMDDCLSGGRTVKYVKELQQQLAEILLKAHFTLRKWRSNDSRILKHLECQQVDHMVDLTKDEAIKTLGLLWNSRQDTLQYQVNVVQDSISTKRSVLSRISQVFDPLGLIGPVLIIGKMLMQALWIKEVDWDVPLDEECLSKWNNYYSSLAQLHKLIIPRNINPGNHTEQFTIVGFADASEKAYGACIYVVSQDRNGFKNSHLLCAKSKVAPLKTISLPRLELEAALLLANLLQTVKSAFSEKIKEIELWSDSTIVLGWIQTEPNRLKTFVANRVSKIQIASANIAWYHVPSSENPADLISRGVSVDALENSDLWWHGPSWLTKLEACPKKEAKTEIELPELKNSVVMTAVNKPVLWSNRFSSFNRFRRIIAMCYRFISNCRKQRQSGNLTLAELERAEKTILRWIQQENFSFEISCLKMNRDLPKRSPLQALKAFIDKDDLLRVGGRLTNAELPEYQKYPVILPARNYFTSVILREEHERLHHCPPEQLLHSIRQRYWPLGGRRETQQVVKHCIKCFKFHPVIPEILMGDLPAERVKAFQRPFTQTGVDYAGPLQVRESRRRGKIHVSKGYVAVFTCMSTKAVHLELVSELTTESFLAALNRFTARRGICTHVHSDNGTNFSGAAKELEEIYEFLRKNREEITEFLKNQRVEWHFIPPRAPNFGGLWEAAVKLMKRHLRTLTQGRVHTFEEYSTLLAQIEAIMNSRPLTPVTNDPTDLFVLTPAHFLIGESLIQPPEYGLADIPDNKLSRWQQFQKLRQVFWKRWQTEYLQELQKRNKWFTSANPVVVGTLVLVMQDNVPPLHWPLGRIMEVHAGKDGIIRVVTVKTNQGIYKRTLRKLCPLPKIDESEL